VWDTAKKEFVTFKKVSEEHSLSTVAVIERDDFLPHLSGLCHYPLHLLHQTADDMFEELGFEKKIINGVTNYIKELIYVGGQRKIAFYNNSKGYSTTIDRWGEANLSAVTSIPEHQAIHQKLIELGWIE
jgi:hypothetical protein